MPHRLKIDSLRERFTHLEFSRDESEARWNIWGKINSSMDAGPGNRGEYYGFLSDVSIITARNDSELLELVARVVGEGEARARALKTMPADVGARVQIENDGLCGVVSGVNVNKALYSIRLDRGDNVVKGRSEFTIIKGAERPPPRFITVSQGQTLPASLPQEPETPPKDVPRFSMSDETYRRRRKEKKPSTEAPLQIRKVSDEPPKLTVGPVPAGPVPNKGIFFLAGLSALSTSISDMWDEVSGGIEITVSLNGKASDYLREIPMYPHVKIVIDRGK